MDWSDGKYVAVIPGKVSGVPLVRDCLVGADTVLENHELGKSVNEMADNYDLQPREIIGVLAYASARTATKTTE